MQEKQVRKVKELTETSTVVWAVSELEDGRALHGRLKMERLEELEGGNGETQRMQSDKTPTEPLYF